MIDILIPLYNVDEKTFSRCLASIASQTIVDQIEVTVCDDYSPINCIPVIKRFCDNIKINYTKNEVNLGVGVTRQKLIELTNNEYIMWIDADDTLSDCLVVERFLAKMESNKNNQLVIGGYYRYHGNLKVDYTGFNITWLFSKMYKRSELEKFDIKFNNLRCNEDVYYNTLVFSCFKNYMFIDEPMYLWQDNVKSITRDENKDDLKQSLDFVDASISVANWLANHSFSYSNVVKNWAYDGLIQFYWEYCKLVQDNPDVCDQYMNKVFEYYKITVKDINEFANNEKFSERYNVISQSCIPTVTIWDWLWKLADRNGEFE